MRKVYLEYETFTPAERSSTSLLAVFDSRDGAAKCVASVKGERGEDLVHYYQRYYAPKVVYKSYDEYMRACNDEIKKQAMQRLSEKEKRLLG